jgi:hypothetical protein
MTSPYSSGGGGTHLEARVAASCLVAVLCEASVRGLPGEFGTQVKTQRAAFGDPLDDVIVIGVRHDGRETQLDLQVKNKLTFTTNDEEWSEVLTRAWDTFSRQDFDATRHRLGVGIGTYNARVDQHYQSILKWAEGSTDGDHFIERITHRDFSHQDKKSFVQSARTVLEAHTGRNLTNDELWRFLKVFVIVYWDFQSPASSLDATYAADRLKAILPPQQRDQANKIWDHLVAKAGELIPVGGAATRQTLLEQLDRDGFTVGAAPSFWKDIQSIRLESQRALDDIKSHIHGLKLHRTEAYDQVRVALSEGRFVQIDGEPGTGKSALLKEIAEECARTGPVFVLKDSRIHPRGWPAHAHVLGVSDHLTALLREFACAGDPILFIDGIDKVTDPATQVTVNDILKAIANSESLSAWHVLVTVREQNLKHLETWLDPDALKKLPLRTISVKPLDDDELNIVAANFPRLRALLTQSGGTDVIVQRPFFLNALLDLAGSDGASQLPATEVELLKLWWELGGSDRKDYSPAQHRRNALIELADRLTRTPNKAIAIRSLAPEPLSELIAAGVLRDKELGHSLVFTHDIYEEWTLCEFLVGQKTEIDELLKSTGEPDALMRPMQLLGTYLLETDNSTETWKRLLNVTADTTLRPVWHRAVLTSCLQSTRATQLLTKLTDYLTENESERLKKLLLALSTIEVLPNPLFLNEQLVPDLSSEDRAKYAHHTAVPKPLTWLRFLNWLMPQTAKLPPLLIPNLLPVFTTWQNSYAGQKIRHCREIGKLSYAWLKEVEQALHPKKMKRWRNPFDGALRGRDIEKPIRALFLSSAGDVPSLASAYLRSKASDRNQVHIIREQVLQHSGALIRHLPSDLVDFFLAAFLENPEDNREPFGGYSALVREQLGVSDHHQFYPASPVQPPFLALLRSNEKEGLRLLRLLCNHCISMWRKIHERGRSWSQPQTPIPVTLTLPWGTQTFWGDGQVYLWFRGVWGNAAVESALMALEQWALERVEGGDDVAKIIQKIVEGNDSVAVLGIAVSLCLAHAGKSLECALPLATCPYLWEWDIARLIQESGLPSNELGNWHQDRLQLSAVRTLNRKPHRKNDIRCLVPYFVFSGEKNITDAFTTGIRSFPDRLPFSYEEEKKDDDYVAGLREKMTVFAQQADPQYWKTARTADGNIQLWTEPPYAAKEEHKKQQEHHAQHNEFVSVALWANKSLETGQVDDRFSLDHALSKARSWDRPDLFDTTTRALEERHRVAAVAGTAFVIAKHCSAEAWNADLGAWCIDVLGRAATGPEVPQEFSIREALLLMHPAVFAAYGYSALLAREYQIDHCQKALLSLAVDALQWVQVATFDAAKYYAASQTRFYWLLLDIAIRQCIVPIHEIPNSHSVIWDEREAASKLALIARAESLLETEDIGELPTIPMPWVKPDTPPPRARRETHGYERNETVFLDHLAKEILSRLYLEPLLSDPGRRRELLRLVRELLQRTIQEIVPPFVKSRRDRTSNVPFGWVFDFFSSCGKLCAYLTAEESKRESLTPIWAQDTDTALLMMQNLTRAFMIHAFLRPQEINCRQVALWSEIFEWLLATPEWKLARDRDRVDREFVSCAINILFCVAPDFSPLICGVDPGWPHLRKFLPTIERAICEFGLNVTLYLAVTTFLKRGGFDLMPEPALPWLHTVVLARKANREFWEQNGENTVELLKQLISQKSDILKLEHRRTITLIADILVDNGVRGAGFLQQELLR